MLGKGQDHNLFGHLIITCIVHTSLVVVVGVLPESSCSVILYSALLMTYFEVF